jgi:4a-hydroxytetrahydrobiopterin dehydratase
MANESTPPLAHRHCTPCAPGTPPVDAARAAAYLKELSGWQSTGKEISKTYKFQNYHETMAFVNASAWVSHREDHHPDLEVGYNRCRVRYSTHSVGGLSDNDFICAAKLEALFA